MAFRRSGLGAVVAVVATGLALAACDDGEKSDVSSTPALPAGESPLDGLLKASTPHRAARPPLIEAQPGGLDFSGVVVGRTASHSIALVNSGDGAARIQQIRPSGDVSAYTLGGTCSGGLKVAGGESCSIDVRFAPSEAGEVRADVVVTVEGTGQPPLFLSLRGTGEEEFIAPPVPAPVHIVNPVVEEALIYASARQAAPFSVQRGRAPDTAMAGPPSEEDYRVAGLPGIVSTFPVDRSRVITADRYIPAVLENTLNSQLGGRAIAVIERHVYGSDGRMVLLPAGSRVIGEFGPLGRPGESRLGVTWHRILRPDGVSINIEDQAADSMGRTGLPGDLDERFFEKYGSSLLVSAISAVTTAAVGGDSTSIISNGTVIERNSARQKATDQFTEDLSALGRQMVADSVDLRPVLTVAQGTRLVVVPTEDIWLRDPNRLVAVTPPKHNADATLAGVVNGVGGVAQAVPGALEALLQTPGLQGLSPQALQQALQAAALAGLRSLPAGAAPVPAPGTAGGNGQPAAYGAVPR